MGAREPALRAVPLRDATKRTLSFGESFRKRFPLFERSRLSCAVDLTPVLGQILDTQYTRHFGVICTVDQHNKFVVFDSATACLGQNSGAL